MDLTSVLPDLDGNNPFAYAFVGTLFTFLCTMIGAAAVFLTTKKSSERLETVSLGFAAGVMIAASVWSLLIPGMEAAEAAGNTPWIVASAGLFGGAIFLKLLDSAMPHLHFGSNEPEGPRTKLRRAQLLFLAITLHNLPEGGSVGLTTGVAALAGEPEAMASALVLALGIGIQNIPEGAAVSLPMAQQGMSRMKAFAFGTLSGLVEPIAALIVVAGLGFFEPIMPLMLAAAAGAMLYVVVEELIPACHLSEHADLGTFAVIAGFTVMMALDTALA